MKKVLALALVVCMAFALCTFGQASAEGTKNYGVLKVGIMPFGVCVPAQYAYDQGYFQELGLNIEFYAFANGAGINEALAAEEVDVGVSGLAMIFSLASGTCKLLADAQVSSAMGIYVRPDSEIAKVSQEYKGTTIYGSAETIKGIEVLGQTGTSSQYNLDGWLSIFGLTEEDITFTNIGLGNDLTAFLDGQGDAIAASRPYSFQLETEGMVNAGNFEETTDTTLVDVVVARNDVVAKRSEELVLFLQAYEKALEELAADDDLRFEKSMAFFQEHGRNYSENDMRNEMKVNDYVTKEFMSDPDYRFGKAMINIGNFYSECGQIEPENLPNVVDSFAPELLQQALGIEFEVAG